MTYNQRKKRRKKLVEIAISSLDVYYRRNVRRILYAIADEYEPAGYPVQLQRALDVTNRALEADKILGD